MNCVTDRKFGKMHIDCSDDFCIGLQKFTKEYPLLFNGFNQLLDDIESGIEPIEQLSLPNGDSIYRMQVVSNVDSKSTSNASFDVYYHERNGCALLFLIARADSAKNIDRDELARLLERNRIN